LIKAIHEKFFKSPNCQVLEFDVLKNVMLLHIVLSLRVLYFPLYRGHKKSLLVYNPNPSLPRVPTTPSVFSPIISGVLSEGGRCMIDDSSDSAATFLPDSQNRYGTYLYKGK
jgi:hypothetical protein